jgi:hydroxypyruvate reductase
MRRRVLLITSSFLVERLTGLAIDAEVIGPDALAAGLAPEVAARVAVVACAGELSNTLIDALPGLKLVACFSTGYEGIDVARLRARGIALTTGGGVNAHDVADHAVALFLALWHDIIGNDALVRSGEWRGGVRPRRSLRGRRAGLVGLGRIGKAIAERVTAHGMHAAWWGPRDKPDAGFPRAASLTALAQESDVLFVASRSSPENDGLIDSTILRALGPDGYLVNVSRGPLVDEAALQVELRAGGIGGAGLDVFAREPTDPTHWRDMPGVVLSPHVAGFTRQGGEDLVTQLRTNIERWFRDQPLLTPLDDAS